LYNFILVFSLTFKAIKPQLLTASLNKLWKKWICILYKRREYFMFYFKTAVDAN